MTIDPSLIVRQRITAALKVDAALIAMVPSARIYPQKTPDTPIFPFIRFGVMTDTPVRLDGDTGGQVIGTVHCFCKASATVPDPEAQASNIKRRIAQVIDAIDNIDIGGGEQMAVYATGGQVLMDTAEADCFHGLADFEATVT